jgi:hypothetical protein
MITPLSGRQRGEYRSAGLDYADLSATHKAATSGFTGLVGIIPTSA